MPRRFAVGVFLASVLVAFVVLLVAARNDESTVAFTNEAPSSAEVVSLARGGTYCQRVEDVPERFDGVSVPLYSGAPTGAFALVVRDAQSGIRLGGRTATSTSVPNLVAVPTGSINPGQPLKVCVENRSPARLGLYGVGEGERRVVRGTVRTGRVAVVFYTDEPQTLLERIPDALTRAELFKPHWVGLWTFWLLAAAVVFAIPALLAAALWRSLETDEEEPVSPAQRYARFQSDIEPRLVPRVHRFAAPPLIAEPGGPAAPVAVCIEPNGGQDGSPTRVSLEHQTHKVASVFEGEPSDALAATTAPWLAVIRAGDQLSPRAIELLGQAARLAPDALLLTCDEDELTGGGKRERPRLRPGPSPDLLLARDLTSSLVCIRHGSPASFGNGVWRYQTALRLAGPTAAGLAHVPAVLCHGARPAADRETELLAVKEALRELTGGKARVEAHNGCRRVRRPLEGEPSVEVILPFRNHPELLRRCAESVLGLTTYERFSVFLVDNGSDDPEIREVVGTAGGRPAGSLHPRRSPIQLRRP